MGTKFKQYKVRSLWLLLFAFSAFTCIAASDLIAGEPAQIQISGVLPSLNGKDYDFMQSRSLVAILQPDGLKGSFTWLGTGVLIAPNQVLTSAHVVVDRHTTELAVYQPDSSPALITSIRIHEKYTPGQPAFDLAILQLDAALECPILTEASTEEPYVSGFSATNSGGLIPFTIPIQREDETTYLPKSTTTFLSHGHSGSPLFALDESGLPTLAGIFSAQEFSPDRSTQTRYFFAKVNPDEFDSQFKESSINGPPSFNAFIALSKPGSKTVPISERNLFDKRKGLYSVTFISRSPEQLKFQLVKNEVQPVSMVTWLISDHTKKTYLSNPEESISIQPNDCVCIIFRSEIDDQTKLLTVETQTSN